MTDDTEDGEDNDDDNVYTYDYPQGQDFVVFAEDKLFMVEYYDGQSQPISYQKVAGRDWLSCSKRVSGMRLYPDNCMGWNIYTLQ